MKKLIFNIMMVGVVLSGVGCKKFFDINNNPNVPTSDVPVEYILPQAIVGWAGFQSYATSFGEELMGYTANPGGVSGWGTLVTYNLSANDWTGWWGLYDGIQDLNKIIDEAAVNPKYAFHAAAANVMRALSYQALVDAYNNVPYTEANKGKANLTPAYDQGTFIYKAIADSLDKAIAVFNSSNNGAYALDNVSDPLFKGDLAKWKKFANTIKLRLMIRAGNKVNFTNKTFSSDGFLNEDALVNPGYEATSGKANPTWARAYNVSGSAVTGGLSQRVPTFYILAFYDGSKLTDNFRGNLLYRKFPNPGVNQLGLDPGEAASAKVNAPNDWYNSLESSPIAKNPANIGIFKGIAAAQPIMLASESYFLQAEAAMKGVITGDVKALFNKGIFESFNYLNKNETNNVSDKFVDTTTGKIYSAVPTNNPALAARIVKINPERQFNLYLVNNATSSLVNIDLATSDEQKLEAIITQKYIAFNMLFGAEAFNEYRRTGYPRTLAPTRDNKKVSFASLQSQSSAPDKLPTRLQYPQSEFTYNRSNVESQKGVGGGTINVHVDKIFWAK